MRFSPHSFLADNYRKRLEFGVHIITIFMTVLSWVLVPCGFVDQCELPSFVTSALKMETACFSETL
jgi:hypothetical protein